MLAAIESKENILHKWNYKARKAGGEMARGVLEALTHADAVRELRRQGLAILEVQLGDAGASVGEAVSAKTQKRRLENAFRKDDTVSFCSQIAVMLRTGVTLKESLDTFAEQAARPVVAELARAIRDDVCEGMDFSSALAKWPKIFPSLMISLVRAAEAMFRQPFVNCAGEPRVSEEQKLNPAAHFIFTKEQRRCSRRDRNRRWDSHIDVSWPSP